MRRYVLFVFNNPYIGGGLFLSLINVVMGGCNYLFNILASRTLTPSGYGEITTLFAYQALLNIPFSVVALLIIQRMGSSEKKPYHFAAQTEAFLFALLKKYRLAVILFLAFIPFSPYVFKLPWYSAYSLMFLLGITVVAVVYDSLLMGLEFFFTPALIGLGAVIIKLSGVLIEQPFIPPVILTILAYDISTVIKFGLIRWYFRTRIEKKALTTSLTTPTLKHLKHLLIRKDVFFLVITVVATSLLSTIDTIILHLKLTEADVGLYNVWSLTARLIPFALAPVMTLLYVFFTKKTYEHLHEIICITLLFLLSLTGIAIYLGYVWYSGSLIWFLYGKQYVPLIPYMDWAALFGCGLAGITFLHNFFLAKEHLAVYLLPSGAILYLIAIMMYVNSLPDIMLINTLFVILMSLCYISIFLFKIGKRLVLLLKHNNE